jgi:hypothetical protein
MTATAKAVTCRACGGYFSSELTQTLQSPLSTAGWPDSAESARAMQKFDVLLTQCMLCGHVQNSVFDEEVVPATSPLHMYNLGTEWPSFIRQQIGRIVRVSPSKPTILEIGHGDGHFLGFLYDAIPDSTCIGIDPAAPADSRFTVSTKPFQSGDIRAYSPDIIVIRHVLEHLTHPRKMIEQICIETQQLTHNPVIYVEVPSFESALTNLRCSDLLYEHCSHFTTASLQALFQGLPVKKCSSGSELNDEILWSLFQTMPEPSIKKNCLKADHFRREAPKAWNKIRQQLQLYVELGEHLILWGGTGKAASFLHRMSSWKPSHVIDSDSSKVGGWVPGVGLPIESPNILDKNQRYTFIIPSVWRSSDIISEIQKRQLKPKRLLVEKGGELVDILPTLRNSTA